MTALEEILDPELPAVNPLDAWSRGGPDAGEQMTQSLIAMMQDPGAALGAVVHDRAPDGKVYANYLNYMRHAHAESGKPVVLVAARQGTGHDEAVVTSTRAGLPVLDGVSVFLRGVRVLFSYRDFLLQSDGDRVDVDQDAAAHWSARLGEPGSVGEAESLQMLADFGMPTTRTESANNDESLLAAAARTGFPVALKTAASGVLHKSDQQGVLLNLKDEGQLREAYKDISSRLGADVTVAAMAGDGIEMMLGARRDPQFGPIVLIGFGGIHAETLHDVMFALPPFTADHARRCVERLQLWPLLDRVRGQPAADVDAICEAAARFSEMVYALQDLIVEIDVNPVIVNEQGCTVVDALVITD